MKTLRHRVLDLIWTFQQDEIQDFRKFVTSALHSRGRNYESLVDAIVKYKGNDRNSISPKDLYGSLYPGKNFSGQTLKNRLTELLKLAEEFLVYEKLNQNPVEKDKILLEEYLSKRLNKLFEIKYKKTKKFVASLPENDYKFRNIQFLNEVNLSLLNKKNTVAEMHKQHYEQAKYSLYIFLIEVLKNGIHYHVNEQDNIKIKSNLINEFLKTLRIHHIIQEILKSDIIIHKVVCIYYFLYKALKSSGNESYYFQASKLFSECNKFFSDEYKEEIYEQIISYCIIRQNHGSRKFQKELFRVYNEKLEQGLYNEFKQPSYPVNTFRDYVLIGIEVKEYKWVENFVKKYSKELPSEIKDDEINLSHAKLSFATGNFAKALEHLNKVGGLNYLHYSDASVLKMCCYYELDRIEDSYYEIDKLRHYIRNQRDMPVTHKTPNLNFIKIYQKLVNNKSKAKENKLDFLEKEIRSLMFISKGQWLLEKIAGN